MGEQVISQQQDIADSAYERTKKEPIPIADLIRELREKWGEDFGVPAVHGFIREVATCLLHHGVEVGDLVEGRFVSWGSKTGKEQNREGAKQGQSLLFDIYS